MVKILGIMGSPRLKGNTDALVSKILEGAKSNGAETELIILKDLKINDCDGCHTCWKGKDCSKKDDMNKLFPKIMDCDVIVFGTPVYWFGPTALMKAFLDRFVYFNSPEKKQKIKNKKAILAVPFEDTDLETAKPLIDMFEKSFEYLEMKLVEKILVPGVGEKGDILKKKEVLDKSYEIGKSIAQKAD